MKTPNVFPRISTPYSIQTVKFCQRLLCALTKTSLVVLVVVAVVVGGGGGGGGGGGVVVVVVVVAVVVVNVVVVVVFSPGFTSVYIFRR